LPPSLAPAETGGFFILSGEPNALFTKENQFLKVLFSEALFDYYFTLISRNKYQLLFWKIALPASVNVFVLLAEKKKENVSWSEFYIEFAT